MRFVREILSLSVTSCIMAACATTPEPAPEVVEITPPAIVETCYPIASLEKVVVPAVVKRGFTIVSIESPSEYYKDPETGKMVEVKNPPIETKTPYSREIEPEKIYYKTPEGKLTTDICELNKAKPAVTTSTDGAIDLSAAEIAMP